MTGYSSKRDAARLVNLFHTALLALGMEWYGEWVPSDANVADIMTRPERYHEMSRFGKIEWVDFDMPPLDANVDDLRRWIAAVREAASAPPAVGAA